MISYLQPNDRDKVGVYCVTNSITGETYTGSGILGGCWNRHYYGYKNGNHDNIKLREAFLRTPQGWEFIPNPIEGSDLSQEQSRQVAFDIEQEFIDSSMGDPLFLNISSNSRNCRPIGIEVTDETKQRMRQGQLKYWESLSEEEKNRRNKISFDNLSGYTTLVKENGVPEEVKRNQSLARIKLFQDGFINPVKGTKITAKHNQNLQAGKEKWLDSLTPEQHESRKAHLLKYLPGNTFSVGRKESPEAKEKRLLKTIGLKRSDESKENIKQGIREKSTLKFTVDGKLYVTYSDAALDHGLSVQTVINRLNSTTGKFNNWVLITT